MNEAGDLAAMMAAGLNSRLTDLGPWFAKYLHRHFIASDQALCLVAERGGRRVGYGAALINRAAFYREFMVRKGVPAALVMLPWLLRPARLRTAVTGLFYSSRAAATDPAAEFVVMIVAPDARRQGVGSAITFGIIDALERCGVPAMKVTTPPANEAANALYERHGFEFLRTERLYRDSHVNVYRYPVRAARHRHPQPALRETG